ncbi:MAG: low temperature requirement protein A, partial [Thermomicrobiales bacterium]
MQRIVRRGETGREAAEPLELFYDLVFAFTITQVSHLLIGNLGWQGAIQAGIVLLAGWWSWNYTTWFTDELDGDAVPVRLLLLGLMALSLLLSIAIPDAFGDRGVLFAVTYVAIQLGRHGFLAFVAAGRGTHERERALHIMAWFAAAAVFWIGGAFVEGRARIGVWGIALLIDYAAPRLLYRVPGRRRLGGEAW